MAAALEAFAKRPGDAAGVLVACTDGDKLVALAAGNAAGVAAGFNAGNIIKSTGGRGGGKPNFAQGTYAVAPSSEELRAKVATAIG